MWIWRYLYLFTRPRRHTVGMANRKTVGRTTEKEKGETRTGNECFTAGKTVAGTKDETGASVDDGIPFACHVCTNNNIDYNNN